jgi:hypothetical protein
MCYGSLGSVCCWASRIHIRIRSSQVRVRIRLRIQTISFPHKSVERTEIMVEILKEDPDSYQNLTDPEHRLEVSGRVLLI